MRAAVVFAVAAVDAYFRVKIVDTIRKQKEKSPKTFVLSGGAEKLISNKVSQKNFSGKDYKDLEASQRELVDLKCRSNLASLLSDLADAIGHESFQDLSKIDWALEIMNYSPAEVWGKFDKSSKSIKSKKKSVGRPAKKKVGPKIDAKLQLRELFNKRHKIAHEADIVLSERSKIFGKPRQIKYTDVKKWLEFTKKAIVAIDTLLTVS